MEIRSADPRQIGDGYCVCSRDLFIVGFAAEILTSRDLPYIVLTLCSRLMLRD